MPRRPRFAPPNYTYHIMTRGNNKQNIFFQEQDYIYYLKLLEKYKKQCGFLVYHYVLMPNHVHIMGEQTKENQMSWLMKHVNASYALFFRKKYGGIGHFWQDRFKSIPIFDESYHLKCASYIELNPLEAMLVKSPREYEWSSYKVYAFGEQNPVINIDPIYQLFGEDAGKRKNNYMNFINTIAKHDAQKLEKDLLDDKIQRLQERIHFMLIYHRPSLTPPSPC